MKSVTVDRHANARDRKQANARKMVVTNRSIFTIQEVLGKKAKAAKSKQAHRDPRNMAHRALGGAFVECGRTI